MKIISDHQIPRVKEMFSSLGEVNLMDGRAINSVAVRDADILLIRSVTNVNSKLLDNSSVKFVASATSGIDHIDCNYLLENKIDFAWAPGSNAQSVVEYVLSCFFVLASQNNFLLSDRTVGVIGCGEVGSRLVKALKTINIPCLINDPPLAEKTGIQYCDIKTIQTADIITLHVPLTYTGWWPTHQIIDKDFLSELPVGAILINTSRGGVMDESALKIIHEDRPDITTVLDVWENEPDIDRDLLANVTIATPHIAGYSIDGKLRATKMIYDAVCKNFRVDVEKRTGFEITNLGHNEIRIADDVSEEDAMQMAILAHYDVRSDSAALRRMLEIDPDQAPVYFDELRKNYPVRREFHATTVNIPAGKHKLANTMQNLGFRVSMT